MRMQVIHRVLLDGKVEHFPFSRYAWATHVMGAEGCAWTHPHDDCHDPALRALAQQEVEVVEVPKIVPSPEPVIWPPESDLTAMALSKMCTLCLEDCATVLLPGFWADRPHKSPPKRPEIDDDGQFLLF